jgi:hypothetical protein
MGYEFFMLQRFLLAMVSTGVGGLSFGICSVCLYPEWFLKANDRE